MRWGFAVELQNIFAQISLQGLDTVLRQKAVQVHLLRHHRFALNHAGGTVGAHNFQHLQVGQIGGLGPVNVNTVFNTFLFELLQKFRKLRHSPLSNSTSHVSQDLQLIRVRENLLSFIPEISHCKGQVFPKLRIRQGTVDILFKIKGRLITHWSAPREIQPGAGFPPATSGGPWPPKYSSSIRNPRPAEEKRRFCARLPPCPGPWPRRSSGA